MQTEIPSLLWERKKKNHQWPKRLNLNEKMLSIIIILLLHFPDASFLPLALTPLTEAVEEPFVGFAVEAKKNTTLWRPRQARQHGGLRWIRIRVRLGFLNVRK